MDVHMYSDYILYTNVHVYQYSESPYQSINLSKPSVKNIYLHKKIITNESTTIIISSQCSVRSNAHW